MRKILKLITNRVTIVTFLILLQLGVLLSLAWFIPYSNTNISTIYFYVQGFFSVIISLHVVGSSSNPGYKISWVILILAFPVFGCLYYVTYHTWNIKRRKKHRITLLDDARKKVLPVPNELKSYHTKSEAYLANLGWKCYNDSKTTFYKSGESLISAVLDKLRQAKKFIFVEFFIIKEGKLWDEVLEILKEKVNEGVEVRLLYDDLGASDINYSIRRKMRKWGIDAKAFNPVKANINLSINHRDHRKIVIIDGLYAFTGGINIGDEYNNTEKRFGHWLDCGIMLEGDSVFALTVTFFENWMWDLTKKDEIIDITKYNIKNDVIGKGGVLPFSDSPLDEDNTSRNVILDMFNQARKKIYICTPYLILDNELVTSLSNAAKSNVDVRIVIPKIPDKKTAYMVTKSYAYDLMKAGVKVYKYTPGFNHAKAILVDDSTALIGTTNLDYRSLYLHYENNVILFNTSITADIEEFFTDLFIVSEVIPEDERKKKKNIFYHIWRGVLRVFAPQL
ncbi:cardiolipin synthase [Acholeplasma sp. OttesenSCG-928-E16]|nr:cardiolipin synthase [Acholeplasma sp. OttesenSCG-928-E16]